MAKIPKTKIKIKSTKIIDKQRTVEIMKANINPKTNNPNYSKISNLTGVDRKTFTKIIASTSLRQNLKECIPKWKTL